MKAWLVGRVYEGEGMMLFDNGLNILLTLRKFFISESFGSLIGLKLFGSLLYDVS